MRQLVDLVDVAAARQGVQKPVVRSRQGGAGSRWSFNDNDNNYEIKVEL